MRVHVDLGHPAHVHFFRGVVAELRRAGHGVTLSARDKDVTLHLLRAFGLDHVVLSSVDTPGGIGVEFLVRVVRLRRLLRDAAPHVLTAIGGSTIAPVGRLMGIPTLAFTDTEHVALDRYTTYPLATRICTPEAFRRRLGPRHVRYRGFHELAYLHPARFRPDPSVLDVLGLAAGQRFTVLRLVSWRATHDRGHSGFVSVERIVEALRAHGPVFVSSEGPLPIALSPYRLAVPPERVHDVLAFASLYIGEGATMATEAALLGTPSIYVSSLVGTMGNFDALERAGLVISFRETAAAVSRASALLADPAAKSAWQARARLFAEGHVDVTAFACSQLLEMGQRCSTTELFGHLSTPS